MNNFDVLLGMKLGGGGGSSTLVEKTITANGTYNPADDNADGYSSVTANVPNTYTVADEGKVVDSGALVSQTAKSIDANGLYDTTLNNSVSVDVPNSYTVADEGKVVSDGALVAQTAYPSTIVANGTYDTTLNNSVTVDVPPTPAETKSVIFYDYDGTVLYSYTPTEFAALTEMPANPTHTGLTAQGWNWSLADAKTYVEQGTYLNIGQQYITDDNKTRLYCTFDNNHLSMYLYIDATQTADIDWGDGTTTTVSTTGVQNIPHTYANAGDYVISLGVGIKLYTDDMTSNYSAVINDGTLPVGETDKQRLRLLCINKVEYGSTQINYGVFKSCGSLTTVTMPTINSNTAITDYGFWRCIALKSITIPSRCTAIFNYAFYGCYFSSVSIPKAVTYIGNSAFQWCTSIDCLTCSPNLSTLGSDFCAYARRLKTLVFGTTTGFVLQSTLESLETLIILTCGSIAVQNGSYYALNTIIIKNIPINGNIVLRQLYSCNHLEIPNEYNALVLNNAHKISNIDNSNVRIRGEFVVEEGYSLRTISVPSGCTSFRFKYAYCLKSITLPNTIVTISDYACQACYVLTSIEIPSGVTSIGQYAFDNCRSLASVAIPSSVTSIGSYAFQGCYHLETVELSTRITTISNYLFSGCLSLKSVAIPSGVTSIGQYAFDNCRSLTTLTFEGSTPPTVANANAWTNVPPSCVIQVPTGSLTAYTTAANYPDPNTYTYVEY